MALPLISSSYCGGDSGSYYQTRQTTKWAVEYPIATKNFIS